MCPPTQPHAHAGATHTSLTHSPALVKTNPTHRYTATHPHPHTRSLTRSLTNSHHAHAHAPTRPRRVFESWRSFDSTSRHAPAERPVARIHEVVTQRHPRRGTRSRPAPVGTMRQRPTCPLGTSILRKAEHEVQACGDDGVGRGGLRWPRRMGRRVLGGQELALRARLPCGLGGRVGWMGGERSEIGEAVRLERGLIRGDAPAWHRVAWASAGAVVRGFRGWPNHVLRGSTSRGSARAPTHATPHAPPRSLAPRWVGGTNPREIGATGGGRPCATDLPRL